MSALDDAIAALYRAPLTDFVAERKRLAGELKQSGDKDGAARLAKLARPPVSAWAVNQLWWLERGAFEELLTAAARVKAGDREASRAHREALGSLRETAARLLRESGNAAADTTLRRVTTTLSAIAATGSFAPDPPGALAADRDPPGFEALGFVAAAPRETTPRPKDDTQARTSESERHHAEKRHHADADRRHAEAERRHAEAERRQAEAERRRAEAEAHERRRRQREELAAQLRDARSLQTAQQRELTRLRAEVEAAEQSLKETQTLLADL